MTITESEIEPGFKDYEEAKKGSGTISGLDVAPAPKRKERFADAPKEKFFSIDDQDFFIPKEIPPNIVFTYLRDARRGGAEMAFANMFVSLCGEEALDALAEYDRMTEKDMKTLMKTLQKRVLGALELGN